MNPLKKLRRWMREREGDDPEAIAEAKRELDELQTIKIAQQGMGEVMYPPTPDVTRPD